MADYSSYVPGYMAARSVWDQGIAPLAEKVQGFLKGTAGLPSTVKDYAVEAGQSEAGLTTQLGVDAFKLVQALREGIKEDPLRAIAEMYPPVGAASDLFETNQLLDMAQNAEETGDLEKAQTLRELANTIVLMGMVPGGPPAKKTIEQKLKEMAEKRRKLQEETGLPYVPNKEPALPEPRRSDPYEPELDRIERQRRFEEPPPTPQEPSPTVQDSLFGELDLSPAARAARAAEQGYVHDVYHGSTWDIPEFDLDKASPESHFGRTVYTTTSPLDASENYAGRGADLSNKIQRRAEEIADSGELSEQWAQIYRDRGVEHRTDVGQARNEARADLMEIAEKRAKDEILGDATAVVYPLKGRSTKIFDISKDGDTFLRYEYPELDPQDYLDAASGDMDLARELAWDDSVQYPPEGELVDFLESLQRNLDNAEYAKVSAEIWERAGGEGLSGKELDEIFRNADIYAEDATGNLINNDVFRKALEDAGYDTIIHDADIFNRKGFLKMRGTEGEKHILFLNPNQLRSPSADFDPLRMNEADLQAGVASLGATEGVA